ncbi:MAG: hypothetical protein A3F35_00770 [Candidatus Woykebacteria bacterium RIFCSPHIGHO2_12_FULL_45_10]|uniref:Methyltransferase domain-containing protein n=1 Tax=Candidatus Woykebacteria bacterium RIFCSPHIGHO2_12_FULL_45_10 TaxID=1802603 RepID=A0A1G1WRG0_9BACT|nr:MAG: hypothetical protein A3F35_00770 [Candidatus Woykebacteria bacterium RIFCSPHIGHO2_12_FULL_45_10]
MSLFEGEIAKIYDLWTKSGYYDFDKEAEIVSKIIGPNRSIIELGIGTGNTAIPLAKKGYEVFGIDDSKNMLGQLEKKLEGESLTIDFELQDIRKLKVSKTSDVALSAGGAFVYLVIDDELYFDAYFSKESEIVKIFSSVWQLLNPGGLFLINVQYHGEHYELKLPDETDYWFDLKEVEPRHLVKTHYFKKDGKIYLEQPYDFYRWTREEIDTLAKETGFQINGYDETKTFYIFQK